ncbi:MAG: MopE-related protein, partial [Myxococcota bacterium]|nr:MopE-related protein [Myxococcota bacterium]
MPRSLRPVVLGAIALCVSMSSSCGTPLTQIVLVVESELSVPIEIDRLEVIVLGPSGERTRAETDLLEGDAPSPPYTLGITPAGTRLAPVHIRVVATRHGNLVVERVVRTEFQWGRSVELVIRLERQCAIVRCVVDATCSGGQCLDPYVASERLPPFRGVLRPPDPGPPCTGAPGDAELCDGVDQDCDGVVDEGFDLDLDPAHCGVCGNECASDVACLRGSCGDAAVQVASGEEHTCALRASGHVACWGANEVGQLADLSRMDSAVPVEIAGVENVVRIGIGERHTCALERDGTLLCWGWNAKGQLGDGTRTDRDVPIEVPIEGVVELGVGYEHTCVRTSAGEVWCWGSLARFDDELGTLVHEPEPFVVEGIVEPIALVGGNESTCAIEASRRVVCWGQDVYGRLGDGAPLMDRDEPAAIAEPLDARTIDRYGTGYFAIASDGGIWGWGSNEQFQLAREGIPSSSSPLALVGVEGATQIGGGRRHGCALGADGVRCWG